MNMNQSDRCEKCQSRVDVEGYEALCVCPVGECVFVGGMCTEHEMEL